MRKAQKEKRSREKPERLRDYAGFPGRQLNASYETKLSESQT